MHEQRSANPVPAGLPLLAQGSHARPEDGACFMEYASVLAGEPFTDHPRCTHPLLASACRAINDCIGDRARQELAPLAAEVVGTRSKDPRVSASLTLCCLAASHHDTSRRSSRAYRVAQRRLERCEGGRLAHAWLRLTEAKYTSSASYVVATAIVITANHHGDRGLHALLTSLLDTCRGTRAGNALHAAQSVVA